MGNAQSRAQMAVQKALPAGFGSAKQKDTFVKNIVLLLQTDPSHGKIMNTNTYRFEYIVMPATGATGDDHVVAIVLVNGGAFVFKLEAVVGGGEMDVQSDRFKTRACEALTAVVGTHLAARLDNVPSLPGGQKQVEVARGRGLSAATAAGLLDGPPNYEDVQKA